MILQKIANDTRKRYEKIITEKSMQDIKNSAMSLDKLDFPFEKALKSKDLSYILEVKKKSPSKGVIAEDFPYLEIAKEYEKIGAAAISCLTEPKYFSGNDKYLFEISKAVSIPVLRKDFTLFEYQIYEARTLGAAAVLLIVSLLDDETLKHFIDVATFLGMSALVEAHDGEEIKRAINSGAKIIGVNNRNLKDFTVDINNSTRYRNLIPKDILFVSESGVRERADIEVLEQNGTNAVLIGETIMKAKDKRSKLSELKGE